ncbi:hypothetical protein LARV_00616 [Longilinea arvoryzae]|uniref:ScyD/ScyE family protein n=1 Tax=Longilinea arvoryzae TaxID=360412 RepID=A0A0S7B6N4_9CHLR|nr:ScyD/ScyE family protein [Longilinea arvoryzae]GAP12876.1 hypothetical protein LARV_00616 [Longilinea arvoryzae]
MIHPTQVFFQRAFILFLLVGLFLVPTGMAAASGPVAAYTFAGPIFGLSATPDNSLLVADAGAGVVSLRNGKGSLVAALPGVSDVASIGRGDLFAITSKGDEKLYRISNGATRMVADLGAYEAAKDPDGAGVDSNPFDVQALTGGQALVADAGGNDLLIVDAQGNIDWVATLPEQLVSTTNAKTLAGCPNAPAEIAFVCGLPPMMPAQAVATSVAIGPDGAYYMGELKGIPGALNSSRVWRIEPGTRHAQCGSSPACSVVADGFTSIVDLAFGPDGTLYVTEFDEASFLAVELGGAMMQGGTVNACDLSGNCSVLAGGLSMPIGVTVDKTGQVYAAIQNLTPNAQVVTLP